MNLDDMRTLFLIKYKAKMKLITNPVLGYDSHFKIKTSITKD